MNRLILRSSSRMSFQSASAVRSRLPTFNKIPVDLATEAKLLNFNQLASVDLRNAVSAVAATKNKKVQNFKLCEVLACSFTNMFLVLFLFVLSLVKKTNQFPHQFLVYFFSFECFLSDSWIVRRSPRRLAQEIRRLSF